MNLPKSKLENISPRGLFANHPVAFWVMFGIIVLLSGIAIWGKFSFKYRITDIKLGVNRDYCQQDSDCALVSQEKGYCPGCGVVEAVNIETKNRDEEAKNKQLYKISNGIKKYICPTYKYKCLSFVNKQAVCEQNRCVVKEKQPANDDITISLNKTEYQKSEPVNITIQNNEDKDKIVSNIAVEKYLGLDKSGKIDTWEITDRDIESPCGAIRDKANIIIPAGSSEIFLWDPYTDEIDPKLSGYAIVCKKADLGKYRVRMYYHESDQKIYKDIPIYSNEFEISNGSDLSQNKIIPAKYKLIGSFASPGESSFVQVMGDIVYLTDISEGLLAIDVSNPEKPVLLDKIKIGNGSAYALAMSNNSLYGSFIVVGGYGNTKVAFVDINNSKALKVINEIDAKRTVQDIVMEGDYIYLAIDGPEIEIIRVEGAQNHTYDDATRINKQGIIEVEGGGHVFTLSEYWDSALNKPYLLVGQGESGISYYDLIKPAAPKLITHISDIGYVSSVALKDNLAYVNADGNLKIIDLKNKKVISDTKIGEIWSLKIKDNLLYVASGEQGVRIIDVSNPEKPKQIAIIDTPGRARNVDVSVDGNYIYVADDRDDLQIIKKD